MLCVDTAQAQSPACPSDGLSVVVKAENGSNVIVPLIVNSTISDHTTLNISTNTPGTRM